MVCKLCWNLLKVRLDSNTWVSMLFQASRTSGGAQPTQGTHWERCSMLETHHGWQIEAFFSPLRCIFMWMPMELCSDMDCWADIAQGAVQESPGLRLTQCTRKDILGSWPNHCVSCLLGSGYVFFFFSAPNPTVFEKGTLSSLFIFKSVLTVWLTKEGCLKVCAENPSCCSLCSAESGWERERHIKAWAQSRFRALTLIFLALVGLS